MGIHRNILQRAIRFQPPTLNLSRRGGHNTAALRYMDHQSLMFSMEILYPNRNGRDCPVGDKGRKLCCVPVLLMKKLPKISAAIFIVERFTSESIISSASKADASTLKSPPSPQRKWRNIGASTAPMTLINLIQNICTANTVPTLIGQNLLFFAYTAGCRKQGSIPHILEA